MNKTNQINALNTLAKGSSPTEIIRLLANQYAGRVVFSTSFGLEDQVVTDIILSNSIPVTVFTIDTGRLFNETYKVHSQTIERYKAPIKVYFPDTENLEGLVTRKGPFSFYRSVEDRQECCHIRKVEPLGRALMGMACWITGIRAEQSETRNAFKHFEWEPKYQLIKYHPLLDWSSEMVKQHITARNIPYNTLHDRGYPSIGCAPCTRAIEKGEASRAGRWWWENNTTRECGLHNHHMKHYDNEQIAPI
jgi:phosphoadenosine phosphosulfate reductase